MNFLKKFFVVFSLVFLLVGSVELIGTNTNTAEASSYTYIGWWYHSTINTNVKAEKLTVGSISIAVAAYLPWTKWKIATGIGNLYYQLYRPNVYMTIKTYRKYANIGRYFKPVAGEKTVVYFYSDSSRSKLLTIKTNYEYTSWYY